MNHNNKYVINGIGVKNQLRN